MNGVAAEIFALFERCGHSAYYGEPVSQLEHALQTANLASEAQASPSLVVASLMHDVGHLLHGYPEEIADRGVNAVHEAAGASWLCARFGPDVTEPVRLHVAAKRYLCRTDPAYAAQLSRASFQSLALQGGAFGECEASEFRSMPFYADAVALRRWDDAAKVPGLTVPGLEYYRHAIGKVKLNDY